MPNTLDSIGPSAFRDCSSLLSIDIPIGVSEIENNTFRGCTSLQNINISEGVTNISGSAFDLCDSLRNIQFPSSLESIGTLLLDNLDSIIFTGNAPLINGGPIFASSGTVYHLENAIGFTSPTWEGRPVSTYSSFNTFSSFAILFYRRISIKMKPTPMLQSLIYKQMSIKTKSTPIPLTPNYRRKLMPMHSAITNLQDALSDLIDDAILAILSEPQKLWFVHRRTTY